ncbi:MAG: FhaA domain-containing protein [Collinsella aerofaciens]
MNFLNIFEDHVAGIFGATRAPFSFKKLAKQAARDMEDQTLVINGVNTAPALYTILIAADDDPMLAPFYPELSREVREFVKAQAEKRRYVFVGEPLVRFMIDPQLRAGKFSVFAENVDAPTLGRLYEEERAYQNGLGQNNPRQAVPPAPRAPASSSLLPRSSRRPRRRSRPFAVADPSRLASPTPPPHPSRCRRPSRATRLPAWAEPPRPVPPWALCAQPASPPTWRALAPRSARSPSSSTS